MDVGSLPQTPLLPRPPVTCPSPKWVKTDLPQQRLRAVWGCWPASRDGTRPEGAPGVSQPVVSLPRYKTVCSP